MKRESHSIKEQVKQLTADAEARLAELLDMRADLDVEIVRLRQVLKGLHPVLEDNYKAGSRREKPGIKQMCFKILQTAYEPLTATEIVKELKERGFPIDDYTKPLAVVSTTLKRMVANGEALPTSKDGKAAYKWNPTGTIQLDFPELDKTRERK
jgi:hypothetical protein